MRFLGYSLLLLILLAGPVLVVGSLLIEHWSWARWGVLFFALAFPLALLGDIMRETPEQRTKRLETARARRHASRKIAL